MVVVYYDWSNWCSSYICCNPQYKVNSPVGIFSITWSSLTRLIMAIYERGIVQEGGKQEQGCRLRWNISSTLLLSVLWEPSLMHRSQECFERGLIKSDCFSRRVWHHINQTVCKLNMALLRPDKFSISILKCPIIVSYSYLILIVYDDSYFLCHKGRLEWRLPWLKILSPCSCSLCIYCSPGSTSWSSAFEASCTHSSCTSHLSVVARLHSMQHIHGHLAIKSYRRGFTTVSSMNIVLWGLLYLFLAAVLNSTLLRIVSTVEGGPSLEAITLE